MLNAEVKHYLNPLCLSLPKHMDDLTQHRKRRLQALVDGPPYFGNQSAFAVKAGLTKGRVSQLLDPRHSFGERAGMALAATLRLKDKRYFDNQADESIVPTSEREELAAAIELITKALANTDEFHRGLVRHSLSQLGLDSGESVNISHKIADLLVTKPDESGERHDSPSTTGKIGVLIGGSASKDLGEKHGRSDRDAEKRSAKR